jgi:hypothetical protein
MLYSWLDGLYRSKQVLNDKDKPYFLKPFLSFGGYEPFKLWEKTERPNTEQYLLISTIFDPL